MAVDVKNDATLGDSLIAYYELEEASGTRADSKGTINLTDTNSVGNAVAKQGNGADFENIADDNASGSYLRATTATALELASNISISMWVKFETTGLMWLIDKKCESGEDYALYALYYDGGGNIKCRTTNGTATSLQDDQVAWTPSTATWYHLGWTRSSTGVLKFYVNGSQQGTDQAGYNGSLHNSGTNPFMLGRYKVTGSGNIRNFDGVMDEVGVWSKVLDATSMSDLYNSGNGIPYDAGSAGTPTSTAKKHQLLMMGVG